MRIERTKNATRNVAFGLVLKIYSLALPFVMRTAMIYLLGVEYLGLNSLFTSILQVLNLAELGVGSAMVFSMYEPIAKDNSSKICALMKLYRLYYRIIGSVILIVGLAILPFIPKLIAYDTPADVNVYILYLLNLLATVLTYWLFAYRNCLFQAHQRLDVISKITLITDTIKYTFQLLVLFLTHNYYYYVIVILLTQILNNVIIAACSKKMFPQYHPTGTVTVEERKSINQRIKDLFTSKVGSTIVNSVDTIVISAFLGLTTLAIYQNYYYILSALLGVISIIFSAVVAGSGNSMITESREKNFQDFRKITMITIWTASYGICGLMCLYQPLMKVWVGEELMLSDSYIILFCIYFLGNCLVQLLSVYKDAAGIWHQDRFRPLIAGLVNLTLNLILVHFIGLYGIVLSTILSVFFVSLPWIIHNVFILVFPGRIKVFVRDMIIYLIICAVVTSFTYLICSLIPDKNIFTFLLKLCMCSLLCNICLYFIYMRMDTFVSVKKMLLKTINRKT